MCVLVAQMQHDRELLEGEVQRERVKCRLFPMGTERGTTYPWYISASPQRLGGILLTTSAFSPTAGFRLNRSNPRSELETWDQ